jgi:rubredoxin
MKYTKYSMISGGIIMTPSSFSITGWLFPIKIKCPVCAKKNFDYSKICKSCNHVFTEEEREYCLFIAKTNRIKYGIILSLIVLLVFIVNIMSKCVFPPS